METGPSKGKKRADIAPDSPALEDFGSLSPSDYPPAKKLKATEFENDIEMAQLD